MKRTMIKFWMVCLVGVAVGLSGCTKISTRVIEKPRLDQKLDAGNRGYIGSGARMPEEPPRKTTRKFLNIDVELPTLKELTPWPIKAEDEDSNVEIDESAMGDPDVVDDWSAESDQRAPVSSRPTQYVPPIVKSIETAPIAEPTTYVVVSGDTLEKIADKVYGDSKKWRVIYDANRDLLDDPNHIYQGNELLIPALPKSMEQESGNFK